MASMRESRRRFGEVVMSHADIAGHLQELNLDDTDRADEVVGIRRPVQWIARPLLLLAVLALGAVSFATTAQGFALMLLMALALVAAIGLQTTLFVAEVIYSALPHVNFQKMCAGAALILSGAMSVFFSYAGIRHGLNSDIAKVDQPFALQREIAENDSNLTNKAIEFKGAATTFMQSRELSAERAFTRARADYMWFRDQATRALTDWRRDANEVTGSVDATQAAQLRLQEQAAERRYSYFHERQIRAAETVDTAGASFRQIDHTLQRIQQFAPNFIGLTPAAKQSLLASWISAWSAMPPAFQTRFPMPAFYHSTGPVVPPGREESILAALDSMRHPTQIDAFALLIAFLLDFTPALAILSTGAREHTGVDARIRAARGWMTRVWQQAQLSEGVFPWTARVISQLIAGKPATLDNPDFRKFAAALDALDAEQQKVFAQIVLPEQAKEWICTALQGLHVKLQTIGFQRTSEMETLVDLTIADLAASIVHSPTLTPQQKTELSDFLHRQLLAFHQIAENLNPCIGKEA
jgi:hypothetical protein